MKKLIQTSKCSIVYGDFKGEKNQELFRCPRELDDKDLKRYVNEYRDFFHFVDDDCDSVRDIEGKVLIGYYRMYFRGDWCGRWFLENESKKPSEIDCYGVDEIIRWLRNNFKHGCDWTMSDFLEQNFKNCNENKTRFILKPYMSDKYKVMFDTTYGNGDYPIRIYVYE